MFRPIDKVEICLQFMHANDMNLRVTIRRTLNINSYLSMIYFTFFSYFLDFQAGGNILKLYLNKIEAARSVILYGSQGPLRFTNN